MGWGGCIRLGRSQWVREVVLGWGDRSVLGRLYQAGDVAVGWGGCIRLGRSQCVGEVVSGWGGCSGLGRLY